MIRNLKYTYCRLKPSQISGVGIFAIRDIPKEINPFQGIRNQKWYKINKSKLEGLDEEILKMIHDFYVNEDNKNVWIPEYGLNGMDITFFLNHSKNPNLKTIDDGLTFITLKDIKKDEELTIAYETYDHITDTTEYK